MYTPPSGETATSLGSDIPASRGGPASPLKSPMPGLAGHEPANVMILGLCDGTTWSTIAASTITRSTADAATHQRFEIRLSAPDLAAGWAGAATAGGVSACLVTQVAICVRVLKPSFSR